MSLKKCVAQYVPVALFTTLDVVPVADVLPMQAI